VRRALLSPSPGVDVPATSALSRPERLLARVEEATMALGVHSEVGKLRKVLIHRPGLEHTRLTPSNAEELLFDDVLWVKKAKDEHDVRQR
jgi:hypothetical protein